MLGEKQKSAFGESVTLSAVTPVSTAITVWRYRVPANACVHVIIEAVGYRNDLIDRFYREFTFVSDSSNNVSLVAANQIVSLIDQVQGDVQVQIDAEEIYVEATGPFTGVDDEKWTISIKMLITVP